MVEAKLLGLASCPTPQQGLGKRVPLCVCGGVQDPPPGLVGERAPCSQGRRPCLRMCFQSGVGGTSRSPSVPPSLLPTLCSGPSWVPGRPPAHPGVYATICCV